MVAINLSLLIQSQISHQILAISLYKAQIHKDIS